MTWAVRGTGREASAWAPVVSAWCRRAWSRLERLLANLRELEERRLLAHHPWEEEFLHWSADGQLHGALSPPDRRRRSVSPDGWCLGLRTER